MEKIGKCGMWNAEYKNGQHGENYGMRTINFGLWTLDFEPWTLDLSLELLERLRNVECGIYKGKTERIFVCGRSRFLLTLGW